MPRIIISGGGGGNAAEFPRKFKTGLYYTAPSSPSATEGTVALTLNNLMFAPFAVGEAQTFDRIAASVTTLGATSVVRLGIYADTDGQPGTLVLDAGTIDASTTGYKEITISQVLAPGLYWMALVAQVAVCTVKASGTGSGSEFIGGVLSADIRISSYAQTGVTGALPGTATPVAGAAAAPVVKLRAA